MHAFLDQQTAQGQQELASYAEVSFPGKDGLPQSHKELLPYFFAGATRCSSCTHRAVGSCGAKKLLA